MSYSSHTERERERESLGNSKQSSRGGGGSYIWEEYDAPESKHPHHSQDPDDMSSIGIGYPDGNESLMNSPSNTRQAYTISNLENQLSRLTDYTEENIDDNLTKWKQKSGSYKNHHSESASLGIAQEIESKVRTIKVQLADKVSVCRDLHDQLLRLRSAKESRIQKKTALWEDNLESLKSEYKAARERLSSIVERLSAEVKKLSEKEQELLEKKSGFHVEARKALERFSKEQQHQRGRMQLQLRADEKAALEKAAATKAEAMKKQIGSALAPSLDKLAREGKSEVMEKKARLKEVLQGLKHTQQAETEDKLRDHTEVLKKQLMRDAEEYRRKGEKRVQEEKTRLERQAAVNKERFQREKVQLEDLHEQQRKLETIRHADLLADLGKSDSLALQEQLNKRERELNYLQQMHAEELDKRKQALEQEIEVGQEQFKRSCLQQLESTTEQEKQRVVQEVNAQTDRLMLKLREDASAQRGQLKRRLFEEVEQLRVEAADALGVEEQGRCRLEGQIDKEKEAIRTLRTMHRSSGAGSDTGRGGGGGGLGAGVEGTWTHKQIAAADVGDLQDLLQSLRRSLIREEGEAAAASQTYANELVRRREDKEAEVRQLGVSRRDLETARLRAEESHARKRRETEMDFETELTRIRAKIAALLERKRSTLANIRARHQSVGDQAASLATVLEEARHSALV